MTRTTTVECSGCPASVRLISCDSLGFVKVIQPRLEKNGPDSGPLEVVARWGNPGPDLSISAASLSAGNRIAVARKSGVIEVIDSRNGTVCATCTPPVSERKDESDALTGIHLFNSSSWGQAVLSCQENGRAALQKLEQESSSVVAQWDVCKSETILAMKVHGEKYAAFGGKGVELNLWDLETTATVWSAKKPKADRLLLIPPAWVTSCTFLSSENHSRVACGTGDHQVRVYDVRAQRRHVIAFDYGESPIKALTEDPDGFTLFVGTGDGNMGMFDTRTGKLIAGFKGKISGSVRSIARHPSLPLVASCGLDRFLRIHDVTTRQLAGKVYLKQPLVSVAFDDLLDARREGESPVVTPAGAKPGHCEEAEPGQVVHEDGAVQKRKRNKSVGQKPDVERDGPAPSKKQRQKSGKSEARKVMEQDMELDDTDELMEQASKPRRKQKRLVHADVSKQQRKQKQQSSQNRNGKTKNDQAQNDTRKFL